jgi:hypothetical protein
MMLTTFCLPDGDGASEVLPKRATVVGAQLVDGSWHILMQEPEPKEAQNWSKMYPVQDEGTSTFVVNPGDTEG